MPQNSRSNVCCIPDCDEPVRYHLLQVCVACYSGLARWRGRTSGSKQLMMKRYVRLQSRMNFIMKHPKHHPQKIARRDDLDGRKRL